MTIFKRVCCLFTLVTIFYGCATTMTPLTKASSYGDVAAINTLLKQGVNVNEASRGASPLHWAACYGQVEAVKALLEAGADINGRDRGKFFASPLHWAARYGQVEVVKVLITAGADVNARDHYCDGTPLVSAIAGATPGRIEIANILIAKGVDIEAIDCVGWKARNHAEHVSDKPFINILSSHGKSIARTGMDDPDFKPTENNINFRNAIPQINYSGTKKVKITVLDKRAYVVSGKTKPNYVGHIRPNPLLPTRDMTTTDKLPLSDVLTSCILSSLKKAGFEVNDLSTKPDRSLVFIINEWMSDGFYNIGFTYNLVLQVMDKNGVLLSLNAIDGLDELGSAKTMLLIQSKLLVPDAAKKRLGELFNNPEIKKALQ